jgi:hypothetical protein
MWYFEYRKRGISAMRFAIADLQRILQELLEYNIKKDKPVRT